MLKCNACGATYPPVQWDGSTYFHTCPPLAWWELEQQQSQLVLTLTPAQLKQFEAADKIDQLNPPAAGAPTQKMLALQSFGLKRPNARDENLISTDEQNDGAIKSAGAGVTVLPDA